jgi:hypothetical protein
VPRLTDVGLNFEVLGWTLAISLLSGIAVALAPAIVAARSDVRPSAEGGRRVSAGAASRRIRRALVAGECALAIVLLVGAGLLLRSWRNVTAIDPGVRPERVLFVGVSSPRGLSAAARPGLYSRILERIHAVPGVESAGMLGDMFISNSRHQVVTTDGAGSSEQALPFSRDEATAGVFRASGWLPPWRRGGSEPACCSASRRSIRSRSAASRCS